MTTRALGRWLVLACVLLEGCATTHDPRVPRIVQSFALAPYALHEACVQLRERDRLDYRFTATEPVRFGIQYRDANALVVPIQREATREDAGMYPVAQAREYCLVWEAGPPGALLDYRFVARPPSTQ